MHGAVPPLQAAEQLRLPLRLPLLLLLLLLLLLVVKPLLVNPRDLLQHL
jgi:hypothetical protein